MNHDRCPNCEAYTEELDALRADLARALVANADHAAELARWKHRAERAEAYTVIQEENIEILRSSGEYELARVEGERDAALLRIDDLEADATKAMHDAGVLKRLEYNRIDDTGSIEAVVQSPFMRILGEWIAADFKLNGGTNYVEQELSLTITDHSEPQVYTVLVQKAGGKTPAQVAGELRKHNALLRAECEAWREMERAWDALIVGSLAEDAHAENAVLSDRRQAIDNARAATDAAGILKGGE